MRGATIAALIEGGELRSAKSKCRHFLVEHPFAKSAADQGHRKGTQKTAFLQNETESTEKLALALGRKKIG